MSATTIRKYVQDLPASNATTFVISHNLNTEDIVDVRLTRASTTDARLGGYIVSWTTPNKNQVQFELEAPIKNGWRVIVAG